MFWTKLKQRDRQRESENERVIEREIERVIERERIREKEREKWFKTSNNLILTQDNDEISCGPHTNFASCKIDSVLISYGFMTGIN